MEATDIAQPIKTPTPDRWSQRMARRLSPLAWKRFIPEQSQAANSTTKLTDAQVQNNCFAVLGFLEEYYRPSASDTAEVKDVDLSEEGTSAKNEDTPRKKSGLEQLEDQLDDVLRLKPIKGGVETPPPTQEQHQIQLGNKLSELLAIPQVTERFEEEFSAELPHYQVARGSMRQVRDIDRVTGKLRRAIYRRYLTDKQQYGKLNQSSVDQIYFFQGKLDELEKEKQGIKTAASPDTLGYLETQKLLDYKRQLQEKGFIMTPSREQLIDRITREALAGKKIFLVGSTGTGKTQLAFYALNNLTGGYELINWHEGTTPRDLFGYRELWTDESGGVQSGMKSGPVPKALERQVGVIHEEYTGGSTRTQLAAKFMMGARPGDKIQIPGFNGQVFDITNNFTEIFTGNPKDEKTKQREDMDPAILRELTGVEVNYMSAQEMNDVVRAMLIGENGVLKLGNTEIKYIKKLTQAAEMMQKVHNRDFAGLTDQMKTLLGIDAQGNTDTTLNTNFLDPGTLFKLFGEWELASARGQHFPDYMRDKLREFISDPKTLSTPEERRTLQKILHTFGLITDSSGDINVVIPSEDNDKGYILPSQMAGKDILSRENPMGGTNGSEPGPKVVELEKAEQLFDEDFLGEDAIHIFEEKCRANGINVQFEIPSVVFQYTEQQLKDAKEEENKNKARLVSLRPEWMTVNGTRQQVNILNLRNLFRKESNGIVTYDNNPFGTGAVFYTNTWFDTGENFAKEQLKAGYALPTKDVVSGSWNKKWADQTTGFDPGERRREANEAVWDILLYYAKTGNKLVTTRWDWTNSQTSGRRRVDVGFYRDGLSVGGWFPGLPDVSLGVCSSR